MSIPSSPKEILEPHVAEGETILTAHASEIRSVIATDRRVLIQESEEKGGRDANRVQAIPYANVAAVTIDQVEDESPDTEQVLGGIVSLALGGFVGLSALMADADAGSEILGLPTSRLFLLLSVFFLSAGAYYLYLGYDTEDGHVSLTLQSGFDFTESIKLPVRKLDVAETISEAIATYHAPTR